MEKMAKRLSIGYRHVGREWEGGAPPPVTGDNKRGKREKTENNRYA